MSDEIYKADQVNRVRVKKQVVLNRLEICSVRSNSIFFTQNLDSYQQIETC